MNNSTSNEIVKTLEERIAELESKIGLMEIDMAFLSANQSTKKVKAPATPKTSTPRTGITSSQMITNLKDNAINPEALLTLFTEHEELFIKSVSGIRDDLKALVLPTIQTKYPQASISKLNPKVKYVQLYNEELQPA